MIEVSMWYDVIKIDEQTYCLKEHLHWEQTNIYYLIGDHYNVLIDSGTGIQPLRDLLESIDNKPIKVLTTHLHWDHIGNHHEFEEVFCHPLEMSWLEKFPLPLMVVKDMMIKDVDDEYLEYMDQYSIYNGKAQVFADCYDLGNRLIKPCYTPGHSPGHTMFHDTTNNYLFTGDHLYEGEIYCHYPSTSPVDYVASTKAIQDLDQCQLLTGHHKMTLEGETIKTLYHLTQGIENVAHGSGKHTKDKLTVWF